MTLAPLPLRSAEGLAYGPASGKARANPECRTVRRQMHGGKPKSKLPGVVGGSKMFLQSVTGLLAFVSDTGQLEC